VGKRPCLGNNNKIKAQVGFLIDFLAPHDMPRVVQQKSAALKNPQHGNASITIKKLMH
jgi:hypothetical protein